MSCEFATYYVERNEALQAAQLLQAQSTAKAADNRLKETIERAKQLEHTYNIIVPYIHQAAPKLPDSSAQTAEIERYIADANDFTNRIDTEIERAEGLAQLRTLITASHPVQQVSDWSTELQQRQRAASEARNSRNAVGRAHRRNSVERIVGRLRGAVSLNDRLEVKQLIDSILESETDLHADNLEVEFRLRIQRINERVERAAQQKSDAERMLSDIRGFNGADIDAIRREVQQMATGQAEASVDLADRVASIRTRAAKEADDIYAGEVIGNELRRLGYVIDGQFTQLFTSGGATVIVRPERPTYGVRIQVDSHKRTIDSDVVRIGVVNSEAADQHRFDLAAEQRWQSDHENLRSVIRGQGLVVRLVRRSPPGSHKMPVIESAQATGLRRVTQPHSHEHRRT